MIVIIGVSISGCYAFSLSIYNYCQNHKFKKLQKKSIIQPTKVFQIGFNKCGTTTIANFFRKNGVPTIHHDDGILPYTIHDNYVNGLPLIPPFYQRIHIFTDMDLLYRDPQISVGLQYFKELDKQYPGSKFILNTRNKNAWLKSRALQKIMPSKNTLLKITAQILQLSESQVLQKWSDEWDQHHLAVIEYFKLRPDDLLVFDIENDRPEKIAEFLKNYYILDTRLYKQMNKTSNHWLSSLLAKLCMVNFTPVLVSHGLA